MGPFLVEPLLEELATVAESPAPVHDARRLLEARAARGVGEHKPFCPRGTWLGFGCKVEPVSPGLMHAVRASDATQSLHRTPSLRR